MIKDQLITNEYALYNADCMDVLNTLDKDSIDLSIYSPPFCGLYQYSSLHNDFSNCASNKEFLDQYEFLIKEMSRVTKPGRITAVHCTDIINTSTYHLWDFPHEIILLHEKYGFKYTNRIIVWKDPLVVRNRTMVKSLHHKSLCKDSTNVFTAMPDYLLIFKRTGENQVPVTHETGLRYYAGANPMINDMIEKYGTFEQLQKKYWNHSDPKTNKLSHIIWQRYASSVWDDIRIDNVLQYKNTKDEDDEKHVHPLQLDVIDRIVELYSNPGEIVLTPFAGVGSEVYSPVSMGRKAIGIELKDTYYKQMIKNLSDVSLRFADRDQLSLIA